LIKIVLRGSHGGELDCRTVDTIEEANDAVKDIVLNCVLAIGDTLTIEGETND
jgi:hypothetical protein